MSRIAIVVGGAECWRHDLDVALLLLSQPPEYYVVNDQIMGFQGDVVACTLHPEKLDGWLQARTLTGLAAPRECWTKINKEITDHKAHQLREWGGTSGLFAFQVARAHGHDRVLFCGVPMDESRNAFQNAIGGIAVYSRHQRIWNKERLQEIKPYARSLSGWTANLLGPIDSIFLGGT